MNIDNIFQKNAALIDLVGRLLLVAIFVITGVEKMGGFADTQGFMASKGVPGLLLPVALALEIGGGLAIAIGWKTRLFAFLIAGYCVLAAAIFHSNFADQQQFFSLMRNVSMAGGFLVLVANGPGRLSIEGRG